MQENFTLSIKKENQSIYIFCKDNTTLDCHIIHNIIFENLQENEAYRDISLQDVYSYEVYVFLESTLLTGGNESKSLGYECFFGEIESDNLNSHNAIGLDTLKPIYHLIGEIDSNSIESTSNNRDSNNSLSTLQVFLGSNTLTLLNYSLIDSSLNIKLECNSKESKEILEKEQTQREQTQKESTPIDSITSTAFLHPILEDNELKCPHNGVVKLKSNKGKSFKSKGIPMILESDLINSSIVGCTNNIAGVPTPCTMVATILPNVRGLKKFNDDYPIMQDLVSSGVMSDKGFPIICTPKENTFKINSPAPNNARAQSKEALDSQIDIAIPSFTLITPYRDLEEYYFTPSTYENRESKEQYISSQSGFYTPNDTLEITLPPLSKNTDYARLDSNPTLTPILQDISKIYNPIFFSYRILTLRIAYSIYEYLLIIPKSMPKFIVKLLQEKRNKDELSYGYGSFIDLNRDYVRECDVGNKDGNKENDTEISLLHIQGKVLLAPNGCERVRVGVR